MREVRIFIHSSLLLKENVVSLKKYLLVVFEKYDLTAFHKLFLLLIAIIAINIHFQASDERNKSFICKGENAKI